MVTSALPEVQSEYDVWNVATTYWVRVDDWALIGSVVRESSAYKITLNHYLTTGPTYRTSAFMVEPPGSRSNLDEYATRLSEAHHIAEPAWLAPSLHEIVRRLDADWQRSR